MGKLEAYYYPQHQQTQQKPHYTHHHHTKSTTIITQISRKTTTSHLQSAIVNPTKFQTTNSCKSTTTNHKLIFFIPVMQKHYWQCCTKYNDFTAEKQTTDYSNLFSHMISIQTAIAWQIVQQYISPRQASTIKPY